MEPDVVHQQTVRPPFDTQLCDVVWFPLSKKLAARKRALVNEKFRILTESFSDSVLSAFTDGSSTENLERTACAVFSEDLKVARSWLLTAGSSVFTAETLAIKQALDIVYKLESTPEEALIFSDSRTAILAIVTCDPPSNHQIPEVHNLLRCLKSTGTKVTLAWIPSHTGIRGNEIADKLAADECRNPTGNRIDNKLTVPEYVAVFRKIWTKNWIECFKRCQKPSVQIVSQIKRIDWFFDQDRRASICLHRLRSGHNNLNAFRNRIDPECNPLCRRGCAEIEDTHHILIGCPNLENFRLELKRFLLSKRFPFDTLSILGINLTVPRHTQFKIRNFLVKFLHNSGFVNLI